MNQSQICAALNSETAIGNEFKDNGRWAAEFGYFSGTAASQMPVTSSPEQCHQLMIFNGLHAGAIMQLTDGIFSLGRSYECDIVLKDPGIEPIHLKVVCDAGVVALHPELGAVYLDGQSIERETVLPDSPVVVTIAGVHFGLAVEGALWHPLEFPMIREDAVFPLKKDQDKQADENNDLAPLSAGSADSAHYLGTALNRLKKTSALSKFVPVVFILLFIVSAVFFFHVETPDNAAFITDIEKQFAKRHLPKPDIEVDHEGYLDITAYAPDVSGKEEIAACLKGFPLSIRPHIYADDQVALALQNYISKMAFAVEAAYQGNGRASIKGFVENNQEAGVLESLLKGNVMGLRTIDLQVLALDRVRSTLAATLKEADLTDRVNLQPQTGHLLARGILDTEERTRWQAMKKTLSKRLGGKVAIIDQIKNRELPDNMPGKVDIPIAGVTMEPYPFITLQDGKVYFKGASLKNGTVIKDIGQKRIVVEIDGRDYYYNF